MSVRILLFACLMPVAAMAQGFAGLAQDAEGYALPTPDTRFVFPADHGAHWLFRIEWWYATANMTGSDGRQYGMQWTLFRSSIAPGGAEEDQIWMAHAAISSPDGHFATERFARGGLGTAGVEAAPFSARIDEWRMEGPSLSDVSLFAQGADFAIDLTLVADLPFVPQGIEGFSVKSEAGQASHYYSQPFYEVEGTLTLPTGVVEVAGEGWLDREWSSAPLTESQTGWDWASLHLESGEKLMVYRLRDSDGGDYITGTWIEPDGASLPLAPGEVTMTPGRTASVEGREIPVEWSIAVPGQDAQISIEALYPQSWMPTSVAYWEGPVRASGTHKGRGYLEMTGYAPD